MIKLTLLGTGGPRPDQFRQGPALLITVEHKNYLFDAGRGVTTRLLQAGVLPQDLDAIFITHHHFDHIGNLADLLLSIWNSGRSRIVEIYGPSGTAAIVEALISDVYAADIAFRRKEAELTGDRLLAIKDLLSVKEVDAGTVYDDGKTRIRCERVEHGHGLGFSHEEWPCFGYRLVADNKTIAISGDTIDCEGLQALALNADFLVLCCYLAKDEQQGFERDTVSKYILVSSADAGDIARKYRVKTLVLTHIRQKSDDMLKRMEADIRHAYSGKIVMGEDLLSLAVL